MKVGEDAVAVLLDLLNEAELPYMLVGSFSSNRYGVPRATHDADFVLAAEGRDLEKWLAGIPPEFEVDPQSTFELVTATRRQIIKVPSIPFTVGLFELSSDAHDQERFSRRRKLTLLGRDAWFPTPEGVIVQKLRWSGNAKRPKDFEDVLSVMAVQGRGLDWPYMEGWCAQHGTLDLLAEAKAEAAFAWEEE